MHLDHLARAAGGYESVRPLSDEEAAALAPMPALCHAEFALSEADYFLGVLHSEEQARWPTMVGWWAMRAGFTARWPRLLDALRRWAERAIDAEAEPTHMTGLMIPNYLARTGLRLRASVTTVLGIWLTTRRLLICWPVVLAADFLYLVCVLSRAAVL